MPSMGYFAQIRRLTSRSCTTDSGPLEAVGITTPVSSLLTSVASHLHVSCDVVFPCEVGLMFVALVQCMHTRRRVNEQLLEMKKG